MQVKQNLLFRRVMGDHKAVSLDHLITSDALKSLQGTEAESSSNSCGHVVESSNLVEQDSEKRWSTR